MRVNQHLYTFLPEQVGKKRGGAQTVVFSKNLHPEDRARLERHCLYERPDWLSVQDQIANYPVARGYFLLDNTRGVLSRVVYRGKHGIRAGNFLAHHLVFPLSAWSTTDPLSYLLDDSLFRNDWNEGDIPPKDTDLPLLSPLSQDPRKKLIDSLGDFGQLLLAASLASLENRGQGKRVVAVLPHEFFSNTRATLIFAIGLSRLLPPVLRPAFTVKTYQPDPTEIRLRLVFTPFSSPHIKTIKNDPDFLLLDPASTGQAPNLDEGFRAYAKLAFSFVNEDKEDSLQVIQEVFSAVTSETLPNKRIPVSEILRLAILIAEAKSEDEMAQVFDVIEQKDDHISEVLGKRLFDRLATPYFQALAKGKGTRLGVRLLTIASRQNFQDPIRESAIRGTANTTANSPQNAPWKEILSLVSVLEESHQKEVFAQFSPKISQILSALQDDQIVSLLMMPFAPRTFLQQGIQALAERNVLSDYWSQLEQISYRCFLPESAASLFSLLQKASLYESAANIFLKRILPETSDLAPLLPEALRTLRYARYEDSEIGRKLFLEISGENIPSLIVFMINSNLSSAWQRSLLHVESEMFLSAAKLLAAEGKGGLLIEELEKIGLSKQAAQLRADQAALQGNDLFESVVLPGFAKDEDPDSLAILLETVLNKDNELAIRILEWLATLGRQARFMPHLEPLRAKVFAQMSQTRQQAIIPASLLGKRATRMFGARLVRSDLDQLSEKDRPLYLQNLLRRLTLVSIEQSEVAEALFSTLSGAPDQRLLWITDEAEQSGLLSLSKWIKATIKLQQTKSRESGRIARFRGEKL